MKVVHFFDGMKGAHFFDGNGFYCLRVDDVKHLMSCAADACSVLGSSTSTDKEHCAQVKTVLDLVRNLQARFNYKYYRTNQEIPELVNMAYNVYYHSLDNIALKLACELYYLSSLIMTDDEKKKAHYRNRISDCEIAACKLLGELKDGKITYTLKDGKTRTLIISQEQE